MPPHSDRKTFVVLDQDVSVAEGKNLLGRIVTDVRRPLDCFEPSEFPVPSISKYLQDPRTEERGTITATSIRQGAARVALFGLLRFEAEKGRDESFALQSKTIKTFGVKRHEHLFEQLMDRHGDVIEALSRHERAKKGLYMVIAIKVAEDAMIVQKNHATVGLKAHVDGAAAIAFGTGAGAVSNSAIGTVSTTVTRAYNGSAESTVEGERVFAMEYCEIMCSITGFLLPGSSKVLRTPRGAARETDGLRWRRKIKVGEVAFHGKRILAFGGADEDEEADDGVQEDENEALGNMIELV